MGQSTCSKNSGNAKHTEASELVHSALQGLTPFLNNLHSQLKSPFKISTNTRGIVQGQRKHLLLL